MLNFAYIPYPCCKLLPILIYSGTDTHILSTVSTLLHHLTSLFLQHFGTVLQLLRAATIDNLQQSIMNRKIRLQSSGSINEIRTRRTVIRLRSGEKSAKIRIIGLVGNGLARVVIGVSGHEPINSYWWYTPFQWILAWPVIGTFYCIGTNVILFFQ